MTQAAPQSYRNHARYVPLYHFGLGAVLLVILAWSTRRLIVRGSADALFDFLVVLAVALTAFYARAFALAAQDRVIRLELRLRLQELAPPLMSRFQLLKPSQITALRFAGDAELPALAQQVLEGRLVSGADIKQKIQNWQADHHRV